MTASIKFEESNTKINTITNIPVKKNFILEKPLAVSYIMTSQDDVIENEFKVKHESPSDFYLEVK